MNVVKYRGGKMHVIPLAELRMIVDLQILTGYLIVVILDQLWLLKSKPFCIVSNIVFNFVDSYKTLRNPGPYDI